MDDLRASKTLIDLDLIDYYRKSARSAESLSQSVHPELREIYRELAAQWEMLAAEIEARQLPLQRTA